MARALRPAILALFAAGCVTRDEGAPPPPSLSVDEVARRIPAGVADRHAWAVDVVDAIEATKRDPTAERVCAVLAVIEQESNFVADPPVANLPRIVRDGLLKRLDRLGPLAEPALAAILAGKAPGTKLSFARRIERLRTEHDLDRLFRDIEAAYGERFPGTFVVASALSHLLGKGGLAALNPVTTAGSMQVKVDFARTVGGLSALNDEELREALYTRAGGVLAGTARLIDYPAAYDDIAFRFADYNSGIYSSRNAAFQEQLGELTGKHLALDGDLLSYGADGGDSETLRAMLAFGRAHDMWDMTVRRAANAEKTGDFDDSSLFGAVRDAWAAKRGRAPAYARMPEVTLISPKLARPRSTAWYAASVRKRYDACRARD